MGELQQEWWCLENCLLTSNHTNLMIHTSDSPDECMGSDWGYRYRQFCCCTVINVDLQLVQQESDKYSRNLKRSIEGSTPNGPLKYWILSRVFQTREQFGYPWKYQSNTNRNFVKQLLKNRLCGAYPQNHTVGLLYSYRFRLIGEAALVFERKKTCINSMDKTKRLQLLFGPMLVLSLD